MARGPRKISTLPGVAIAAFLAAVVLVSLVAVLWRAEEARGLGPSDMAAIRFTLLQAALSSVISGALAIPIARALARRQFPGRGVLITLLGAPFILPVIVAVVGLRAVFGQAGLVNSLLSSLGLPEISIYGLHGVVLAHVFFNLPLATRILLQGWQAIPAERFRLAASLGMGPGQVARVLEWPMLRRCLPGALVIVFALCLSSFAVALTLGGGPRATTVELAIYESFRLEFDLARAGLLAIVQTALVGGAALLALRFSARDGFGAGLGRPVQRFDARAAWLRAQDGVLLALAALFLVLPLGMVLWRGALSLPELPAPVWMALGNSLYVAALSTVVATLAALGIGLAALRHGWLETLGLLGIAVSPLVLGTGLFILLFPIADPASLALPATAGVNALMSLPFALRVMVPALRDTYAAHQRLALALGMGRRAWARLVLWPCLRPVIGFAAGLTAALSLGDLGVIALFADPEQATLPLQVQRLMSSYRMAEAAGASVLLMVAALAVFWLLDKGGRQGAAH